MRKAESPRERILTAAVRLAAKGGYDAVQARGLARLANVSTRTIYNHFDSLDQVLVEAMLQWRQDTAAESVVIATGDTFEERVLSLYRYNYEAFARHPKLFETFQRVWCLARDRDLDWGSKLVHEAIDAELAAFDPSLADDFRMIMADTFYAVLMQCGWGQSSYEEGWRRLERTVRRLAMTAVA